MTTRPRITKKPSRTKWLSRTDWMDAGQQLLMAEGIAGMRLTKLTKRLRVSTGSFYHHFKDMEDYLGYLADYYSADQIGNLISELIAESPDPLVRIRHLASRSIQSNLFPLDKAMRVWASSDRRAAAALRDAEKLTLEFLADAFETIGFSPTEAVLRARLILSVNVTNLLSVSDREQGPFHEEVLALLSQLPAPKVDKSVPVEEVSLAKTRRKRAAA